MKSFANIPHTIISMLDEIKKWKKCDLTWWTNKGIQFNTIFPDNLYAEIQHISDISQSMIEIGSVEKINQFLRENGFTIQLEDPHDPFAVSAASMINILVQWTDKLEAKETQITLQNNCSVAAVCLKNITNIKNIPSHPFPIIELDTCSKSRVFITQFIGEPKSGLTGLYKMIQNWKKEMKTGFSNESDYTGKVTFPMVDFNREGELIELVDAIAVDSNNNIQYHIKHSEYQHILKINAEGALAKAAVFCVDFLGNDQVLPPIDINIDTPFIIWFEYQEAVPFSAYIMEDDMKKPNDLV